ncbi:MAG TPA: DinB family protein [Flavobacteriales bacterium]|nr:DinB family protein [Flavobacteriales bacterium]
MEALDTRTLIADLRSTLLKQLQRCEELRQVPLGVLQRRPDPKRWSVLEVIEHMNLSSGHYHDRLQRIYADGNGRLRFRSSFQPGTWGQRMLNTMQPKADGTIPWKMPTIGKFEPRRGRLVTLAPLDDLIAMLNGYIGLLERARTSGLEGEKVVSTLGPILRFKVGDAFRFTIAHQERHMLQIERTLKEVTGGG